MYPIHLVGTEQVTNNNKYYISAYMKEKILLNKPGKISSLLGKFVIKYHII